MALSGFVRPDGSVGFRNYTLVVPLTGCLQQVAWRIADQVDGANPLIHPHGCDLLDEDGALLATLMRHLVTHPNVGAVVFLSMGCAALRQHHLRESVQDSGRLVEEISLHATGGTSKTVARGVEVATEFAGRLARQTRQEVPLSSLVVGTKCGASNPDSFAYCHPVLGEACDRLVDAGATVVLSEDCELLAGAEDLAARAATPEAAQALREMAENLQRLWYARFGHGLMPAAMSEEERQKMRQASLGHIAKAGTRPVQRVVEFDRRIQGPGLVVLNGPNTDLESMTALAAAGCHVVMFTTGRGTVVGSPAAITVKMTATASTAQRMSENIDLDVSGYKDGTMSLDEAATKTLDHLLAAAGGESQRAERLGHNEIAFPIRGVTF